MYLLTNLVGVMQRFIRKEVVKRRWASNIEGSRENEIIKWQRKKIHLGRSCKIC